MILNVKKIMKQNYAKRNNKALWKQITSRIADFETTVTKIKFKLIAIIVAIPYDRFQDIPKIDTHLTIHIHNYKEYNAHRKFYYNKRNVLCLKYHVYEEELTNLYHFDENH